jgi:hypothetical protein
MTDCKHIQEMFPAFLEGVVSPEEKRLIHEHLATCQRCSTALEHLRKTQKLVQNLEEVETPPWFAQKIMARVREEAEQKKRGVFGTLFYPLHVKVPIQALASVLIVVLALYVYRSVEPEMKVGQPPSEVARPEVAVPKNEAQQEHGRAGAGSPTQENKAVVKDQPEKAAGTIATAPRSESLEAPKREEAAPPASPVAESAKGEKREAVADKQAQEMKVAAPSPGQTEATQLQKAPPAASARRASESMLSAGAPAKTKEKQDALSARAAPEAMRFVAKKAEPTGFTLHVNDVTASVSEIKKLLGQLGAHGTAAESRAGSEVITSELAVQKVEELFKKLSALGQVEEKGLRPVITEGQVAIRIEVTGKPYTN